MSGLQPALVGAGAPAAQRGEAYRKVMRIFMAGAYDLAKEDALSALRAVLFISEDEHLRIRKEVRDEVAGAPAHPSPPLSGPHTAPLGGGSSQPEAGASVRMSATPFESGVGTAGGSGAAVADSIAGRAASRRAAAAAAGTAAQQQEQEQQQAADSRKRAKTEAGMGSASKRQASRQRSPVPIPPPAAPGEMDPLIGRKVERNWPGQGGWFIGVISDYRPETGEHCIVYDFGTPKESYEWFRVRSSSHNVCRLTTETFDFAGVLPGTKPSSRKTASSKARSSSTGGGGSSAPTPTAAAPQAAHQVNGAATAAAAKPAAAAGAPRAARAGAAGVPRTGSAAAAAKPPVKQGSARLTKVHSGITHAEAVQAALAASSSQQQQAQEQTVAVVAPAAAVQRPRAGFLDLQPRRRRMRDWSSEEEDSEED